MPYVLNKFNPNTQYTGTYRVYKNTAGPNDNWTAISPDLTDGLILEARFHNISAIDNSDLNPQKIYVGTSDANVWVTTNDGGNWTNITGSLPNRYVTSIHASPNFSNNVYVTHTGYKYNSYIPHIHKSTNNGTSWVDISGNLPQAGINDVLVFPGNENNLFVATDIGVYVTYDGGLNWVRVGSNMPFISVWDLSYNPVNKRLIAGTYAKSIQTIDVTTLTTGISNLKNAAIAAMVFPTVTSSEVNVNGKFEKGAEITLYDIQGKKVKHVNTAQDENRIDISELKNGIYLVEIRSEGTSTVKRVIKN
jgi:hypothetical protein